MNTREIRVGDRVKCIDAEASFNKLALGAIYTVEANYDGSPTVFAGPSGRDAHSIDRFELVTA